MTVFAGLLLQATLTGQVLADSTRQPIPGVEVVFEKPPVRRPQTQPGDWLAAGALQRPLGRG
jgi:hypothetical protein